MRGFSTYFNAYRRGKSYNINAEGIPEEVKPVVPTSANGNDDLKSFFDGTNVFGEDISTYKTYCYTAKMHTSGKCSREEIQAGIKNGMLELGFPVNRLLITPIAECTKPNKEIRDYEIFIEVS